MLSIDNGAVIGTYPVGAKAAYLDGIMPNSTYHITAALYDVNGNLFPVTESHTLDWDKKTPTVSSSITDLTFKANGTITFTLHTGDQGDPMSPTNQDILSLTVNGTTVLDFWTDTY